MKQIKQLITIRYQLSEHIFISILQYLGPKKITF